MLMQNEVNLMWYIGMGCKDLSLVTQIDLSDISVNLQKLCITY